MVRHQIGTSRLAARIGIRAVQALVRADAVADRLDRHIVAVWRKTLRLLRRRGMTAHAALHALRPLWYSLTATLHADLSRNLAKIVTWGHQTAAAAAVETLPEQHLAAASPIPVTIVLAEAREPVRRRPLTAAQRQQAYQKILLPPPDESVVHHIVYGTSSAGSWQQRLTAATSLASPEQIATTVSTGLVLGETPKQIEAKLRPVVQGVRNSARRIARSETIRVAHETQMKVWEQLGEQVIGYQIHATLDSHTRPWHAARHGTVYYKQPQPGQKGLHQMPHPPMEPEDPRERPAGTPVTAWNCRCALVPVLQPLEAVVTDPVKTAVFANASEQLVPDPTTYADWWQTATPQEQRLAVGSRRYHTLKAKLPEGDIPTWEAFLDPKTGDLLSLQQLKHETLSQRLDRTNQVRLLIARLRGMVQQVTTFGWLK